MTRDSRAFWAGIVLVSLMATILLVGVVGNQPRVSPEAQRMIEDIKADAANRTTEPCISFTPRGFVPCP